MPRRPRNYIPDFPYHVVQRGNNRQRCFNRDDDFGYYIKVLREALIENKVKLHAFVLMTNHVHLLMTPSDEHGISKVLQSVGRRYVGYFNSTYTRTGTLWEGRHKSSVVETERYLLACYRYIELNPVRANIVAAPGAYFWSSYQHNAKGINIYCVEPHPVYLQLGKTTEERCYTYKALVNEGLSSQTLLEIRTSINRNYPTGDAAFVKQLEQRLPGGFGYKGKGRPKNDSDPFLVGV